MKVAVQVYSQSQAMVFEGVINTYQKGDLFCLKQKTKVTKFPLQFIYKITEESDDGK